MGEVVLVISPSSVAVTLSDIVHDSPALSTPADKPIAGVRVRFPAQLSDKFIDHWVDLAGRQHIGKGYTG